MVSRVQCGLLGNGVKTVIFFIASTQLLRVHSPSKKNHTDMHLTDYKLI